MDKVFPDNKKERNPFKCRRLSLRRRLSFIFQGGGQRLTKYFGWSSKIKQDFSNYCHAFSQNTSDKIQNSIEH